MKALMRAALLGLYSTAALAQGTVATTDEPVLAEFQLPLPNPPFANCPAGYFIGSVEDGAAPRVSRGAFGLELRLTPPGTLRLEGGVNFGALTDGGQAAFAGFNTETVGVGNEPQRLVVRVSGRNWQGNPLAARIRVIRDPAGVNQMIDDSSALLSMDPSAQVQRTVVLTPGFYAVTVIPEGAASFPGDEADGEVFVELAAQFVDRPGGGFFGGVVVGGYHAANPFSGPSGFGAFCLGTQHHAIARVFSTPSYPTGARDLRLRLLDYLRNDITPTDPAPTNLAATLRITNTLLTPAFAPSLNGVVWSTIAPGATVDLPYQGASRGYLQFAIPTNPDAAATSLRLSNEVRIDANGAIVALSIAHDNVSAQPTAFASAAPLALYAPTIDQRNPSTIQALIYNGLRDREDDVMIPGAAGPVVITNRTLEDSPRAYFAVRSGQTANIRVVQSGSLRIATVYSQSFEALSAAARGEITAAVTPETFGPTGE